MSKDVTRKTYVKEDYLSIWLCKTKSEEILYQYVEKDYNEEDDDKIKFQLGRDFNIFWYDEDYFEASFRNGHTGWDILEGHSYTENLIPLLEENYKDVVDQSYNSVIIFYNFNYDGNVIEVQNDQYGYFKFVGSFKYEC